MLTAATAATAADQIYFPATDNVTDVLVRLINQETVRVDIASWYLSEGSIAIAVANRFNAHVPVRIIGDRGAIFESDPHTRAQFYWLANQGVPIRLRFNPTWFPEAMHWKAAILAGQNTVLFGSGNFAPIELAPYSSTNYDDETIMVTSDSALVAAFKAKFDRMWNDTTVEPESIIGGPPYLKDWADACVNEPTGKCDFLTQYPNPAPMIIKTDRLEPDAPIPADLIFGQGPDFNNRLTQEIVNERAHIDLVVYRLGVDNITQALLDQFHAGVPVRIIADANQYTNPLYPEYWLTHANIDKLWAAGVPILQNLHDGVTHMKTLITSTYATNASSNFTPNWQRDHDYFVSASGKPAIYQAIRDRFQTMWNDTAGFGPLRTTPPQAPTLVAPASNATGVSTGPTLVWNKAAWATSYDIYLGTSPSAMSVVGNVPAVLTPTPPDTYSWTASSQLQGGTLYYWKVVSKTFATPVNSAMVAASDVEWFTTVSGPPPPPPSLPSPWATQDVGPTGVAGNASYSNGTFTLNGAGTIWGNTDSFRFVEQPVSGDVTIVARLTSMQNTNTFAKAGLMVRSSIGASAAHVILDVRPTNDLEFMTRPSDGAETTYLSTAVQAPPAWLRLVRSGTTVTGSVSADGVNWTMVGSTTLNIPASAVVGLVVCSVATNTLNTSVFDNVTVTGGSSPTPPSTPASPAPANAATGVSTTPTLTWSATNATGYDVKFGTTNPPPAVTSNQPAASYTPSTLANNTQYFWQIIARNASGSTSGPVWSFTTSAAPQPPGTPASPNPASGATGVSTSASLTWSATNATSYDVKFGTSNPPPQVTSNQGSASYTPATLANSTKYFWQIVAHNANGATTGPVWSFTTSAVAPPPGTPSGPSPASGTTGVSVTTSLTWSATNATSYDVKFGLTSTPPQVSTGQAAASYTPSGLANNTQYFWQIVAHNANGATTGPVWSFTTAAAAPGNIVIYASDIPASGRHGSWSTAGDSTSPNATKLVTTDAGAQWLNTPEANPADYVDVTFSANAGVPYTLWLRLQALGNSKWNDSLWVQFSDATANQAPVYQLNSTSGLLVNLATDSAAGSLNAWGWQNGAYWLSQPTTLTFATSGTHTLRIQVREDGVQLDQIVLSPGTYLNAPPGPPTNDHTIVPKS